VWTWAAAAVIVLALGQLVFGWFQPSAPADERLGGDRGLPRILLEAKIDPATRALSWHAVVGARTYDGVITDDENRVVLSRPESAARSTVWQLTATEYARLAESSGPLFLRVIARDGAGLEVATTGDLELRLR
jgi:hypothetical protein